MSLQALQELINRLNPMAAGLAALGAALDAKVSGAALDPALAACVHELLAALGGDGVLDGVSAEEAGPFLAECRVHLGFDANLLYAPTRATGWSYADARLLQEVGEVSRAFAHGLARRVVPSLDGLAQRFGAPGAAFLDVGVGVAGLAIALAQSCPDLRITGLDVWRPSLALARANVEKAGLGDRIELREQGAERLEDDKAFDLAWLPLLFMPEGVVGAATERIHRALRPGGWAVLAIPRLDVADAKAAAFWRLRVTTWGGPLWAPSRVETLLREHAFIDVRTLPTPPGAHGALIAGRRSPA